MSGITCLGLLFLATGACATFHTAFKDLSGFNSIAATLAAMGSLNFILTLSCDTTMFAALL